MMNNNYFSTDFFKRIYRHLSSDQGLLSALCQLQIEYGINEFEAYKNANKMIHLMCARYSFNELLSDDAEAVLNDFLAESPRLGGYDRKLLLHQLYSGLKMFQHADSIDDMSCGKSKEQLFHNYYEKCGEAPDISCEQLEKDIRRMFGNFQLSPKMMRTLSKKLERSKNMLATAAAIGENGLKLHCLSAMDIYIHHQDKMSMSQAANIVCTDQQMESVIDCAGSGNFWDETTVHILGVLVLSGLFFAIACKFFGPMLIKAAGTAAIKAKDLKHFSFALTMGCFSLVLVSDKVAEIAGRLWANKCYVRRIEEMNSSKTISDIAERMDAQKAETDSAEFVTGEQTASVTITPKAEVFCR